MCDVWQRKYGKPPTRHYHNREWAACMERVGLMPSDTGAPGGKRTGQRMTHFVVSDGPFDKAFRARTFAVPYYDRITESDVTRKKRKVTYTCPSCEDKVYGTANVQPHCGKCQCVAMISTYDTNRVAAAA